MRGIQTAKEAAARLLLRLDNLENAFLRSRSGFAPVGQTKQLKLLHADTPPGPTMKTLAFSRFAKNS
jgi:hypothetical protein